MTADTLVDNLLKDIGQIIRTRSRDALPRLINRRLQRFYDKDIPAFSQRQARQATTERLEKALGSLQTKTIIKGLSSLAKSSSLDPLHLILLFEYLFTLSKHSTITAAKKGLQDYTHQNNQHFIHRISRDLHTVIAKHTEERIDNTCKLFIQAAGETHTNPRNTPASPPVEDPAPAPARSPYQQRHEENTFRTLTRILLEKLHGDSELSRQMHQQLSIHQQFITLRNATAVLIPDEPLPSTDTDETPTDTPNDLELLQARIQNYLQSLNTENTPRHPASPTSIQTAIELIEALQKKLTALHANAQDTATETLFTEQLASLENALNQLHTLAKTNTDPYLISDSIAAMFPAPSPLQDPA